MQPLSVNPNAFLPPAQSPLYMATHDPMLHRVISYLSQKKKEQESYPQEHVSIELSRGVMSHIRDSFKQSILDGEAYLHVVSHVLGARLLEGEFELHSNVIGVLPGNEKRPFLIREKITRETLFSETDIDLGSHMLSNFRYSTEGIWMPLELSANFVEYIPMGHPESGVNRITSRVKAEEELWNKVTDEIFNFDELVSRDKHLRQYSKYIKDVFGIKIVCEDDAACLSVHAFLKELRVRYSDWSTLDEILQKRKIPFTLHPNDHLLEFIETKDYLTCDPSLMKKTGWKALKSVVRCQDQMFEIQVQPLANYYLELDHMAGPSHHSFKLLRDAVREEIARKIPLYRFYRDLLKMVFLNSAVSFDNESASVVITE